VNNAGADVAHLQFAAITLPTTIPTRKCSVDGSA